MLFPPESGYTWRTWNTDHASDDPCRTSPEKRVHYHAFHGHFHACVALPCSCSQSGESSRRSSWQTGCHSTLYSTACLLSLYTFSPARSLCSNGSQNARRSTFCFWSVWLQTEGGGKKTGQEEERNRWSKTKSPANFLVNSPTRFPWKETRTALTEALPRLIQGEVEAWTGSPGGDEKGWGRIRGIHWGGSSINTSPLISGALGGQTPLHYSDPFKGVDGAAIAQALNWSNRYTQAKWKQCTVHGIEITIWKAVSVLRKSKCQQGFDSHEVATVALAALQKFKVHELKGCESVDEQTIRDGGKKCSGCSFNFIWIP